MQNLYLQSKPSKDAPALTARRNEIGKLNLPDYAANMSNCCTLWSEQIAL